MSDQVGNHEDPFSHGAAQFIITIDWFVCMFVCLFGVMIETVSQSTAMVMPGHGSFTQNKDDMTSKKYITNKVSRFEPFYLGKLIPEQLTSNQMGIQ